MRKKRMFLFIAAMLFFVIGFARADATLLPQLDIHVAATPGFVTEPGSVELQFTFENNGDTPITGIALTSPNGVTTQKVDDIPADSYASCLMTHEVTEAELSAGTVSYLVTCSADGKKYSFSVEATIGQAEPDTPVEFLRSVDSRFAPQSGQLTVVYQIINRSSAAITNVNVSDAMDGFSRDIESIASGETVNLIHNVLVTDIIVSAPTLSYERNDAHTSIQLSDLALRVAHPSLSMDFSAERLEDGQVRVTLRLTNTGDVDFRSIAVYDDLYGGIIEDELRLSLSDSTLTIVKDYASRSGSVYRWRISYVDAAGESFSQSTDAVRLDTDASNEDAAPALTAEPKWTKIKYAGMVPITFTIHTSGYLENLTVFESSLGTLQTLPCIDSIEDTIFTQDVKVSAAAEYRFGLTYTDASGLEQTVFAEPISIRIGTGGATPNEADSASNTLFEGSNVRITRSKWFAFALIAAAALLVALCISFVILSRHIRRTQKGRSAGRNLRGKIDTKTTFSVLKKLAKGKDDVSGIQ